MSRASPGPAAAILIALAAAGWVGAAFAAGGNLRWAMLAAPLVAAATLHRPAWGLWILLLAVPLAAGTPGLGFRVANFVIPALVLGAWLLHRLRLHRDVNVTPGGLGLWFALFVAWVAFTSLLSRFPDAGLGSAIRFSILFAVLLAFANLWGPRQFRIGLLAYALALVPVGIYALVQMAALGPEKLLYYRLISPERLSSIYDNPNTLGVIMGHGLVILAAFTLVYASRGPTLRRTAVAAALLAAVAVLAGGLVVSFSRSSYLYVGSALLVLALCHRRLRLLAGAGILAVGAALVVLPMPAWLYAGLRLGSGLSYRGSLWSTGLRILEAHPFTGVGTGTRVFEFYRPEYIPSAVERELVTTRGGGAHNLFLTKGAELGLPGLVLALALFLLLWSRIPGALRDYRRGNWIRGAAAAGVAGLSFRALFESGTTLGMGHVTDSINFFLFALVLVLPTGSPAEPAILVPSERFREGRTGGQRFWAALVDRWKELGLRVHSEDESPIPDSIRDRPVLLAVRHLLVHGGFHRGVVVADQSDGGRLFLLLRWLRPRPRVRLVVVVHHLREGFRFAFPLYVRLARWNETSVLRLAHRVVVHTGVEADAVAARGIPRDRITLVRVGIADPGSRVTVREIAGGDPLRLLWIGGDFERKNLPGLLRALAAGVPATLTVVGRPHDPGIAARARDQASSLGLAGRVRFLGAVPEEDMEGLWAGHDAFVLPSLHEGHGTALDEALIRGMPALASALPVFIERLAGDEVLWVPAGDENALTEALARLRDFATRSRLSAAGLRRAAGFPSWHDTLDGYEAVVREELARTGNREPAAEPA